MSKLTKHTGSKIKGEQLTLKERTERPFIISFGRRLHEGYQFTDLEKNDLKAMQNFFDLASQLSVDQMDRCYRRVPDQNDIIDNQQVQHYGTGNGFRIHGIYIDQRFEVLRIDPNHKKHK